MPGDWTAGTFYSSFWCVVGSKCNYVCSSRNIQKERTWRYILMTAWIIILKYDYCVCVSRPRRASSALQQYQTGGCGRNELPGSQRRGRGEECCLSGNQIQTHFLRDFLFCKQNYLDFPFNLSSTIALQRPKTKFKYNGATIELRLGPKTIKSMLQNHAAEQNKEGR